MEIPLRKKKRKKTESTVKPLVVSKKEAAEMMGVSYNTLHRLIKAGKIRSKKIGRRVIVTVEEIMNYLNQD